MRHRPTTGFTLIDPRARHGFTLIELSIVLVIIGLVVGGVLIGQDLIQAAKVRSAISQIGQYNTAVNTFRSKYQCLPGDCRRGADFGLIHRPGTTAAGDGNGNIDDCIIMDAQSMGYSCEALAFWRDLSESHLIRDTINASTFAAYGPTTPTSSPPISGYLPVSSLQSDNSVVFLGCSTSTGCTNILTNIHGYYYLTARLNTMAYDGATVTKQLIYTMPVHDVYNIDAKLDDGFPYKGKVQLPVRNAGELAMQSSCYVLPMTIDSLYQTAGAARTCGIMVNAQF